MSGFLSLLFVALLLILQFIHIFLQVWHPELDTKCSSWGLTSAKQRGVINTILLSPPISYMETLLLILPRMILALFANALLLTHLWSTITPRSFSALLSPIQLFCLYSTLIHHHHPYLNWLWASLKQTDIGIKSSPNNGTKDFLPLKYDRVYFQITLNPLLEPISSEVNYLNYDSLPIIMRLFNELPETVRDYTCATLCSKSEGCVQKKCLGCIQGSI